MFPNHYRDKMQYPLQNSTFLLLAFGFYVHTDYGGMPKEQRHFVTADLLEATLLEATAHKQCCPKNSAILLRAFLSDDVIEIKIRIVIIKII